MSAFRLLAVVFAGACVLWLGADEAAARAARRGARVDRNRRGGRHRLIGEDDDNDRERARREREKKKEEARRKAAARKKAAAKKPRAAKPAPRRPAPAAARPAKAPAKPTATSTAARKKDAAERQKKAAELVAKAKAQFDQGELLPGVVLLRQVLEDYPDTESTAEAEQWIQHLTTHETYGPQLLLAEAEAAFEAHRYRQAQRHYAELLERFPKSEQADAARQRLAEIRKNDLLRKTVYTAEELEDARLWFLAGNIHLENGRPGEAVAAWRRVVENFPGCPYAEEAARRLGELLGLRLGQVARNE